MKHDPEKAAASYLSGDMSKRRREAFERHVVDCEDCWQEVDLGRRGRSLAEAGRELAPQEVRERVRAVVHAVPTPPRRWRLRWGMAMLASTAVVGLIFVLAVVSNRQPQVIDAVLADYRDPAPAGEATDAKLPSRLGDLAYETSYEGEVGGLDVVVHSYSHPAGHRVLVYQSKNSFPVATGARHSVDGRIWTAAADGVVLFCADDPVPSLVVGDNAREVQLAAGKLGLR